MTQRVSLSNHTELSQLNRDGRNRTTALAPPCMS